MPIFSAISSWVNPATYDSNARHRRSARALLFHRLLGMVVRPFG